AGVRKGSKEFRILDESIQIAFNLLDPFAVLLQAVCDLKDSGCRQRILEIDHEKVRSLTVRHKEIGLEFVPGRCPKGPFSVNGKPTVAEYLADLGEVVLLQDRGNPVVRLPSRAARQGTGNGSLRTQEGK